MELDPKQSLISGLVAHGSFIREITPGPCRTGRPFLQPFHLYLGVIKKEKALLATTKLEARNALWLKYQGNLDR